MAQQILTVGLLGQAAPRIAQERPKGAEGPYDSLNGIGRSAVNGGADAGKDPV
jgi:hypothetical protein